MRQISLPVNDDDDDKKVTNEIPESRECKIFIGWNLNVANES